MKILERDFYKIFVIGLCQMLGTSIGGALFTMYAELYFNASMATIGLLVSTSTLAALLIILPAGVLSDKLGRKPMIILGSTLGVVGTAIIFLASSIEMLFIAQVVWGLSFAIYSPSIQALVADLASPVDRGRAVGFYLLGPSIGMFLGPLIASLLLRFVAIRETYLYSLPIILPSLILAFWIRSAGSTSQMPSSSVLGDFGKVIKNKKVMITSIISASFSFLESSVLTFYPIYALQEYYTDPSMIAAVFSLRNLALMIARILAVTITSLTLRVSKKSLILTALMVSTSMGLLPLTQSLWQSTILMALNGIGHGIIIPMGAMIIAESTYARERGTANSIYVLFTSSISSFGPVLMGFAAEAWEITIIFPMLVLAPVIGLISSKYLQ